MPAQAQRRPSLRPHVRLLVGIYSGIATGVVGMSSFEAIAVPIQNTFVLSVESLTTLLLTVSAGSLLVLFAAGALVDRLGPMTIFRIGVANTVAGAAMVALAGSFGWLMAGRVVGGVGGTAMAVAAVAVLNETFTDDRERAYVFGWFAAVIGAVAALSPVFSSLVAERFSWRFVPVIWITFAAAAALLLQAAPASVTLRREHRELVTPLAAGVALSAVCVSALMLKRSAAGAGLAIGVAVVSTVVFIAAWRRSRARGVEPTFDVSVFRSPGAKALLVAMVAVGSVNLDFYNSIFIQYRIGLSPAQTAQLFIAPQVAGIIGGLVGGSVSARIGSLHTTALALAVGCMAALSYLAVTEESTVWHPLALFTAFTFSSGCLVGTLTKAFMDCAAPESSGAAAAFRQAAFRVGATVAGVVTGSVVFSHFSSNWQRILRGADVPEDVARRVAEAVRGGVPTADVVADPVVSTVPGGEAIRDLVGLAASQVEALKWVAIIAACSYAVALVFVVIAMWRQKRFADG